MLEKIVTLILIAGVLAGCATSQRPIATEDCLIERADQWDMYRIDGVIELNHDQLSFRKNIVIRKTPERFRIDIFDTGLFGAKPTPFLTVYREDEILIRDTEGTRTADPLTDSLYIQWAGQLSTLADVIRQNYHEILHNWKLEEYGLVYDFSYNYQLESITSTDGNRMLEFEYADDDRLSRIRYRENGMIVIDIIIDKMSFDPLRVNELNNTNQRK